MTSDEEQGAEKLAEIIESTAKNPEKAAKRISEKTGAKSEGIFKTIFAFIKDYKNKNPDQSDEAWLEQQFAKPEYADAWEGGEKERAESAKTIVNSVEDYENAKKSLRVHMKLGNSRASWLARQIEIGAEANGKDVAEYAKEVSEGLKEAYEENAELLLDPAVIKEAE